MATTTLTTLFLVAIRTGTLFLFTPIEAIRILPVRIRLLLVMVISILIVANLSGSQKIPDNLTLTLSGLAELCNGLILSISLYAAFGLFQIAGQLIDTQMGLNSLAIFNPASHANEPLSARLLMMLAVLFFFALDGHHKLLEGLVLSFVMIEPGQLKLFSGYRPVIQQCSLMFTLAIMIASPVVICLLIIELSGGVLTRNMPQMNTYFLILPIKMMMGLLIFGLLLNQLNPLMDTIFNSCFQSWNRVMA